MTDVIPPLTAIQTPNKEINKKLPPPRRVTLISIFEFLFGSTNVCLYMHLKCSFVFSRLKAKIK